MEDADRYDVASTFSSHALQIARYYARVLDILKRAEPSVSHESHWPPRSRTRVAGAGTSTIATSVRLQLSRCGTLCIVSLARGRA